jgi:hypothetical protein
MGNNSSKQQNQSRLKTLPQVVDYLAANYILTQNFEDMENLAKPAYCDKLVILTSKVIGEKLNDMEIEYLAQRLKQGIVVNEMTKDNVIFFNRDELSKLDVQNPTNKRRMCIGIAKFYVKVAHLFAAIVGTINPVYTFTNSAGVKEQVTLLNKKQIPAGIDAKLSKVGLCSSRINALLNGQDLEGDLNGNINISPKFCGMNFDKKTQKTRNLVEEPGIPELKHLYYDDKYDFDKEGRFTAMSPEMEKVYQDDVERFYKEFTGEETVPEDIKNFSDIKLRAYHSSPGCNPGGQFTKNYSGNLKDSLFKQYADTIKTMIANTKASQEKLLDILDDLFVFSYDRVEAKHRIIINPSLDFNGLQKLVDLARNEITNLYLTCEKDFVDALEIFEAIVQKQVLDTAKSQLANLDKALVLEPVAAKPIPVPRAPQPSQPDLKADEEGESVKPPVQPPVQAPVQPPKPDTEMVVPSETIVQKVETPVVVEAKKVEEEVKTAREQMGMKMKRFGEQTRRDM